MKAIGMYGLIEVTEVEFNSYIDFHNKHRPLSFERTSGGYFYWYGISLMGAKWFDKEGFFVSEDDYEMFKRGNSLYERVVK